jgi:nitrite reductase/ring-hydroxylating ferredoxin subunit
VGLEESSSGVEIATEAGVVGAGQAVIATLLPFVDRGGFFARTTPSRAYGVAAVLGSPPPPGMYISASSPIRSMRPWPGGGRNGVVFVGENHPTGDDDATPGRWGELERWANEHFEVESLEFRWSAQDYSTADGLPYVGRSPLTKRTLVATGFAKWGLTNGTAAAEILADLAAGRDNVYAEIFSPRRIGDLKAFTKLITINAGVAGRFVGDRVRRRPLAGPDSLEPGDAGLVTVDEEAVAAYRDPSGSLHAIRPICTHLGCHVKWNDAENTWDCPCHGSRFGIDGRVLTGPATEALEEITIAQPGSEEPEPLEDVDELVDVWIDDSFPASDPPGDLPPDLGSREDT